MQSHWFCTAKWIFPLCFSCEFLFYACSRGKLWCFRSREQNTQTLVAILQESFLLNCVECIFPFKKMYIVHKHYYNWHCHFDFDTTALRIASFALSLSLPVTLSLDAQRSHWMLCISFPRQHQCDNCTARHPSLRSRRVAALLAFGVSTVPQHSLPHLVSLSRSPFNAF